MELSFTATFCPLTLLAEYCPLGDQPSTGRGELAVSLVCWWPVGSEWSPRSDPLTVIRVQQPGDYRGSRHSSKEMCSSKASCVPLEASFKAILWLDESRAAASLYGWNREWAHLPSTHFFWTERCSHTVQGSMRAIKKTKTKMKWRKGVEVMSSAIIFSYQAICKCTFVSLNLCFGLFTKYVHSYTMKILKKIIR